MMCYILASVDGMKSVLCSLGYSFLRVECCDVRDNRLSCYGFGPWLGFRDSTTLTILSAALEAFGKKNRSACFAVWTNVSVVSSRSQKGKLLQSVSVAIVVFGGGSEVFIVFSNGKEEKPAANRNDGAGSGPHLF